MRPLSLLVPAILLALSAPSLAQNAAAQLPAARTLAYVEVADAAQADAALKATDMGQLWQSLKPFVDTLVNGFEADPRVAEQKQHMAEELGVSPDDVIAVLKGGFAVAAVDTAPEGGEPQPMPVALFPAAAKKTIAALLDAMKKKDQEQGGHSGMPPLHLVDRAGLACVAVDQNALAGAGVGTLDKDAKFAGVRAKVVGSAQPLLFAFWNNAAVLDLVTRASHGKLDEDQQRVFDATGVNSITAAGLAIGCEAGQIREAFHIAAPGEPKGIFKVLASSMKPLDLAKTAERTPGEMLGAARFDLGAFADGAIALAKAIDPKSAKDIDDGIKRFEQQSGFKLHQDLLDPWGDVWTSEAFSAEPGLFPESVFSVAVKDPARAQQTIARLAQKGGFEVAKMTRAGHEISYLRATLGQLGETGPRGEEIDPQMMQVMGAIVGSASAWTLDGDRMIFAALPQSIEAHFEALQRGNLGQTDAFKQAAPKMAGARMAAITTLKPLIGTVYQLGLKVLRAVEPAIRKAGVAVDTTLLPRVGSFASGVKPTTMMLLQDGDGLTFQGAGGGTTFIAVPVVAIVAAVAIPNMIAARKQGNEAAAIGGLRMLSTAQELYKQQKNAYAEDLRTLGKAQFIDRPFAAGVKNGYRFRIVASSPEGWSAVAVPLEPGKSGDRSFYVDQTGVMRYMYGAVEPDAESPVLE